jgi:membrane protein YqaA with SNARE-associated domain
MKHIVAWFQGFASAIGGPGLFLIAFLDSSFLSLPEINDLLVISMVTQHKERLVYYALMATLGSVAGCFVLYGLGYKGGEAFMRRRFSGANVDRALRMYSRYGFLAVLIPAILPPPAPFKIFVLLAGVARMRPLTFALAIGIGRGFRYFLEGWLAVLYGERAMAYMQDNGRTVALALAAAIAVLGLVWVLWRRRSASARQENHNAR